MAERVPPPPELLRYIDSVGVPPRAPVAAGAAVPPAPAPVPPRKPAPQPPLRPQRPRRLAALLTLLLMSLALLFMMATYEDVAAAKAAIEKLVADLTDAKRALPPPKR